MFDIIKSITLSTLILSSSYIAGISLVGLNNSINNHSIVINGLLLGYSITSFTIFANYALKNI